MRIFFILLSIASFNVLSFSGQLSDHCTNKDNGLKDGGFYDGNGADFCLNPSTREGQYKHISHRGSPLILMVDWKIHGNLKGDVNAQSYKIEYTHLNHIAINAIDKLQGIALEGVVNQLNSFLRNEKVNPMSRLHAAKWKVEKPTRLNPNTQFSRKRIAYDDLTIVLMKWYRLDKSETGALFAIYNTSDYKPKTLMDYLFLQDVQQK